MRFIVSNLLQCVCDPQNLLIQLCELCTLCGLFGVQDKNRVGCDPLRLEYQLIHGETLYSLGDVGTRLSLGAPIGYLL